MENADIAISALCMYPANNTSIELYHNSKLQKTFRFGDLLEAEAEAEAMLMSNERYTKP